MLRSPCTVFLRIESGDCVVVTARKQMMRNSDKLNRVKVGLKQQIKHKRHKIAGWAWALPFAFGFGGWGD